MLLEVATTSGAITGGLIATAIAPQYLEGLFGGILVFTAVSMGRVPSDTSGYGPTGRLDTSFVDPVSGRRIHYGVQKLPTGFGTSFLAGGFSGLLGIGGGVVKVPIMTLVMRMPLQAAIATSNFMIGVTASTSAIIYFTRGYVTPHTAVPTALGVLVGAGLQPRLFGKVRSSFVKRLFQLVLIAFAVQMVRTAFHG
jgi:uncharacterized membrane protein YfcA